jgi:dCTP deaminase
MILSAQSIRLNKLLEPCHPRTERNGLTYGLGPCGYDLRLDLGNGKQERYLRSGEFILAAALERFTMTPSIMARVCDKSSLARRGLSVMNTVIEPGWRGFLTLELVNHGHKVIRLEQGQAIAQVIFEWLDAPTELPYPETAKYQDQEAGPQAAR